MRPSCCGSSSRLISVCLALMGLSACNNPRKLYQRGNYDDALSAAVRSLQKHPGDSRTRALLPQLYARDLSWHQSQIDQTLAGQAPDRWLKVHLQFQILEQQYRLLQRCPAALKLVQPRDVSVELHESAHNAAQGLYRQGLQDLQQPGRQPARQAYGLLSQSLELDPGLPGADQALEQAYQRAQVRLELAPLALQDERLLNQARPLSALVLQELCSTPLAALQSWVGSGFAAADSGLADQQLVLRFHDFEWGALQRDHREIDRLRDSVVISRSSDGRGHTRPVYGTVRARVLATRLRLSSHGVLEYQIRRLSDGRILASGQLPAAFAWENEYGSYQGDRRALQHKDLQLIGGRPLIPPTELQQVIACTQPALQQLRRELMDFYR